MNPFFARFVKDNFIVASGHVLNFAKPLILTPLILKSAPPEVFGAYILIVSIAGLAVAFAPAGVDFLCKRHLPSADDPDTRRCLFYPQLLVHFAALGLIALGLVALQKPVLTLFFRDAPAFSMPLAGAYVLCYAAYGQLGDYFRYTGRMRAYMAASVAYPYLVMLAVVVVRIWQGTFTVNSLLLAEIVPLALISALLAVSVVRELGAAIPEFDWRQLGESVKLGFPLLMVTVNEFLLFSGSRYVIAAFLGVGAVAYFAAAAQLGNLPMFFSRAIGVALPPLLCRARDSGHEREFDAMLHYSVKGHLLVSIGFAAMTLFFGRELLSLFATPELAAAAWPLVPVLAAGSAVYGVSLTLSKVFVVDKETGLLMKASLVSGVVSFLLAFAFVWAFRSVLPAGGAIFLGYTAMLGVMLVNSGTCARVVSEQPSASLILSALSAAAAGFAVSRVLGPAGFLPGLVSGAGSFAVLMVVTGVVSPRELRFLRGALRKGTPAVAAPRERGAQ